LTGHSRLVGAGVVMLGLLLLSFLALDDITTDNATAFPLEYTMLIICGAWCALVAVALLRGGYAIPGGASLILIAAAAWVASDGLGTKAAGGWAVFWPEYAVMSVNWLWFVAVAVILFVRGYKESGREPLAVEQPETRVTPGRPS
jgi:hypothetical protein